MLNRPKFKLVALIIVLIGLHFDFASFADEQSEEIDNLKQDKERENANNAILTKDGAQPENAESEQAFNKNETIDFGDIESGSRATGLSDDDPPDWIVAYFGLGGVAKNYAGILTRISDQHFLAHYEVVKRVDMPPFGCEGGVARIFTKTPQYDVKTIDIKADLSERIPQPVLGETYRYRSYASAEIRPLSLTIRLYKFTTFFMENQHGGHLVFSPRDLYKLPSYPMIQRQGDSENDCKLYRFIPSSPNSNIWKFVKQPIRFKTGPFFREKQQFRDVEFADGQSKYCYIDEGAPIVCDGKLAYMSLINGEHCDRHFTALWLSPLDGKIRKAMSLYPGTMNFTPLGSARSQMKNRRRAG